ncbi:MAG TPA: apolipoprotein N-acyltransferase, partial [Gammaproteobacteria bacterium]
PMLRATTNGISAIIEPDGRLAHTSPQFETAIVKASVQPMQGATPYARLGNYPLLLLLLVGLGASFVSGAVQRARDVA